MIDYSHGRIFHTPLSEHALGSPSSSTQQVMPFYAQYGPDRLADAPQARVKSKGIDHHFPTIATDNRSHPLND